MSQKDPEIETFDSPAALFASWDKGRSAKRPGSKKTSKGSKGEGRISKLKSIIESLLSGTLWLRGFKDHALVSRPGSNRGERRDSTLSRSGCLFSGSIRKDSGGKEPEHTRVHSDATGGDRFPSTHRQVTLGRIRNGGVDSDKTEVVLIGSAMVPFGEMSAHIQAVGVSKCTGFSIVIPTWCNLEFLKICLRSLRQNSQLENQVIVHLNDGSDGSRAYVRDLGIEFTESDANIGICYAVNSAAALARHEWLLFLNDDMYCCPGWDVHLAQKIEAIGHDACMLSGTMIEPVETGNSCVSVRNFGRNAADFREADLLSEYSSLAKADWSGATWPPTVISRRWWNAIGGFSSDFSPGMSSDNDLSMKMWHAGCRCFIGVGDSLVYHFISRSTGKIKKNDGRRQFFKKWDVSQSLFDRAYLRRGCIPAVLELPEPSKDLWYRANILRHRLKYWW